MYISIHVCKIDGNLVSWFLNLKDFMRRYEAQCDMSRYASSNKNARLDAYMSHCTVCMAL